MYKNILSSSGELDYLALVSLVFFFAFFVFVSWRALKMSKTEVVRAQELPFQEAPINENKNIRG